MANTLFSQAYPYHPSVSTHHLVDSYHVNQLCDNIVWTNYPSDQVIQSPDMLIENTYHAEILVPYQEESLFTPPPPSSRSTRSLAYMEASQEKKRASLSTPTSSVPYPQSPHNKALLTHHSPHSQRRQEQNRTSQQAFRDRQRRAIETLKREVMDWRMRYEQLASVFASQVELFQILQQQQQQQDRSEIPRTASTDCFTGGSQGDEGEMDDVACLLGQRGPFGDGR
ncbi:uncharacterized protein AB675_7595 [Cyphellophora attinorum]|uniref:BZIP domain-containing protein n=1 Tax=Cyphellophora attinorum TaxID=1664694 RepID=A0A0N0NMF4_9EURO|nr:uncharacterized protein AB675_7595 [Phialophora attinorum]KPI40401.1 hypothetical protein AB675_7595 [Phialophora attinorum]